MNERRIAIRGIIIKDGKILAQQSVCRDIDTNWCTPGGGLEFNETIEQGLTRELIEETGVQPQIGRLLFIQQYKDSKNEHLEFFYHITNPNDFENIKLENTTHGIAEIETVDFIDPKVNNILPSFLRTIDIQDFINKNKPVYMHNELS